MYTMTCQLFVEGKKKEKEIMMQSDLTNTYAKFCEYNFVKSL
jgi:hypothetical protein